MSKSLSQSNSSSLSNRLARLVWYWALRLMRRSPIRRFNHIIAANLSDESGRQFLERGKRQNAWARKHAVTLVRWSLNALAFWALCLVLYLGCQWLLVNGYFNAPGSPRRELAP